MTDREYDLRMEYARMEGYLNAVNDYGIWKNGVQHIGCMETPVKEVEIKVRKKMDKILESLDAYTDKVEQPGENGATAMDAIY